MLRCGAIVLCCLALVIGSSAHAILVSPKPRSGMRTSPGTKIVGAAPSTPLKDCGGAANKDLGPELIPDENNVFEEGKPITIKWDTTIIHASAPGVTISVNYSATDSFSQNVLATGVDIGNSGNNAVTLTLANVKTCTICQIQWMWESTADGGYYAGCADVQIVKQGQLFQAQQAIRNRNAAGQPQQPQNPSRLPPKETVAHKAYSGVSIGVGFILAAGAGLALGNYWFRRRPAAGSSGAAKSTGAVKTSAPVASAAVSKPAAAVSAPATATATARAPAPAPAPTPAAQKLPPNWEAISSPEGTYFYNKATGVSQWEMPRA